MKKAFLVPSRAGSRCQTCSAPWCPMILFCCGDRPGPCLSVSDLVGAETPKSGRATAASPASLPTARLCRRES